jgi:predicted DNA-binding protein (MmcQ/YjbR family)
VIPGYHLSKRHWNTVLIDGSLPDRVIGDMIRSFVCNPERVCVDATPK